MLFDVVTKEEYGKLLEESGYDRGFEDGKLAGFSDGKLVGFDDGKRAGIKDGITKGETKREAEIALKMKASGFDTDTIEKITGLSAEKIEKL